ncbi:BlaI/MecI/CopY family transcriptional regulator [Marinifilum caeruleilacunae]|uniref:BlaI/MecI/CopY family transcriptional regulator n=1 Tax=Marinifilum caeruleilacunae TaxID=2499076 RepID=A0ABX1X067_9BACT|nr:BlaI/MecI/CopY family transcriptional regulator [Marinifilum caeruleilacunae]NOU61704.1 BlaI/MecI/CopY family transcriptional regulator [Marinifilum caeruleilacunae]
MHTKRLTKREEDVMKILWNAGKGFVKDLLKEHPEPRPHYNTFSTLIRGLEEKGFVAHNSYGNTHEYYPVITREEYRKLFIKNVVSDYFESSYKSVVSYFVKEEKLNVDDLKELIDLIEKKEDKE